MASNKASVIPEAKGRPLQIKEYPYPEPKRNEIVVKSAALAINPIDYMIQELGPALFDFIQYPFVGGSDVAGQVVKLGEDVTRFKVGDRVLGHAVGFMTMEPAGCAFQETCILLEHMASPIPDSLSYERASVIPLGISTAACAMFQKDYLNLQLPSLDSKPTGQALLIWAGSSSVGCNAIQLGVAAGYEVISTSSPKNFDLVKSFGASKVLDYKSPNITNDLLEAFKDKTIAGAFAILPGSAEPCFEVVAKTNGAKFVSMALPPPYNAPEGVVAKFVFGGTLKDNHVGPAIYKDYLPSALAAGKFAAAPSPKVVGQGLPALQHAFDTAKAGVSAQKIVVTV